MGKFACVYFLSMVLLCACASAPTPTAIPFHPTPPALIVSGLEGQRLQSACLGVGMRFPQLQQKPSPPPIEKNLTFVLTELGIKIKPWEESCQTWFGFVVLFEAQQKDYISLGPCFTGASAMVFTTVNLPQRKAVEKQFSGGFPPPITTSVCPGIAQAPFDKAWQKPVIDSLVELFGSSVLLPAVFSDEMREEAFQRLGDAGPGTAEIVAGLVRALANKEDVSKIYAARALRAIGAPAKSAVPALIEQVRTGSSGRPDAILALKSITGQDLGEDAGAWQAWWQKQGQ